LILFHKASNLGMKAIISKRVTAGAKALSTGTKGAMLMSVAVLLVVLVLAGFRVGNRPLLSYVSMREGFAGGNNNADVVLPADWKGPKTDILAREGVHAFFSDGTLRSNIEFLRSRVMFMQTMLDTQCYFTKAPDDRLNCTHIPLKEFAAIDPMDMPRAFACSNSIVAHPTQRANDEHVRILNCLYAFRKRCITLCAVTMTKVELSSLPTGSILMTLQSGAMPTNVFVLSRPVFVCTTSSQLYAVSYDPSHYGVDRNTIIDYNSQRTDLVEIVLYPVSGSFGGKTYTFVTGTGTIIEDGMAAARSAMETMGGDLSSVDKMGLAATINVPFMQIVTFYLTPVKSVMSDVPDTEAFTTFHPTIDPARLKGANTNNNASNTVELFRNYITLQSEVSTAQPGRCTLRIRRDGALGSMTVSASSMVTMTYSTNCVTLAAFDAASGELAVKRFGGFPMLLIKDPISGILESLVNPDNVYAAPGSRTPANNARSAMLPPPFIPLSIPNLLDLAWQLNVPLGKSCF
jgi:hypothetical protein